MKSSLVIGLGNRLVNEDAAGLLFFDTLRAVVPEDGDVEFLEGGTDLLRLGARMRDRELILLIDAVDQASATLRVLAHDAPELSEAQQHVHHLSAVQALNLIRWSDENVRRARCYWVLVPGDGTRSGSHPIIS
jgi:hydrogenase maturation protease